MKQMIKKNKWIKTILRNNSIYGLGFFFFFGETNTHTKEKEMDLWILN